MKNYDHKIIEKKWQDYWKTSKTFQANDKSDKPKFYALDMFPYPSGAGLHVGHPEGYTATDIISRYRRMKGDEVLHPMGWDAFGLPAENYAIKTKIHPDKSTRDNIVTFRRQVKSLGFSYDWDRELATCDGEYYKWTQWWFLFLYEQGLAYKKKAPVNWCEDCKTVLANEQVVDGKCERCKNEVLQKKLSQWFFRITDFIEDQESTSGLLSGLEKIDWPHSTKASQTNWIGRSEGIDIEYPVEGTDETITCFTTRPDTNFGATFVVLAPEHDFIRKHLDTFPHKKEVKQYVEQSQKKSDLERMKDERKKTGVFTGLYVRNRLNQKKLPLYVGDFVLAHVGTGAVVGVPGHDLRDFEFAQSLNIDIVRVVVAPDGDTSSITNSDQVQEKAGTMINSEFLDGLEIMKAKEKIMDHMEEEGWGKRVKNYKLRDWSVSRQRYWGAPIPIIHCPDCGEVPVPESDLPVQLPTDVDFVPTGESPMKYSKTFHEVNCPKCGSTEANRENDTMDTFVCSSWYFFAFAKAAELKAGKNPMKEFSISPLPGGTKGGNAQPKDWLPVNLYVGGAEHTVMHLLYSRFFTKVAHRAGLIDFDEPFQKLRHQGMIMAEDGRKMSKSLGNVINPDEIVEQYGADTLRMYEMFMGPFDQSIAWSTAATEGIYKFLQKIWRTYTDKKIVSFDDSCPVGMHPDIPKVMHQTIKKVTEDIEELKFNTAISQMMVFMNLVQKSDVFPRPAAEKFCKLLAPFAPHLAEEIWKEVLGHNDTITYEPWPEYDPAKIVEEVVTYAVQINGKVRGDFQIAKDTSKEEVITAAKELEKVAKYLEEGDIKKEIFVPRKIVGFVVN